MSRRKWIWVWVVILLLFIIFCIWSKTQNYMEKTAEPNNSIVKSSIPVKQISQKVKDISFEIKKDKNGLELFGVFPSQQVIDKIKKEIRESTNTVFKISANIDSGKNNPKMLNAIASLCQNFVKYKSGHIEYKNGILTINGVVDTKEKMDALSATVLFIDKNIVVQNSTKVVLSSENKSSSKNMKIAQLKLDATLKNKRIEFLTAKDVLTENSKVIIDHICEILKKYPNIKVEIGGHTDSDGSEKSNQILSEKRALAVKNYLIKHGIEAKRLIAVGYGETKPLVDNKIDSIKQLNRRVELKVIKQKEME